MTPLISTPRPKVPWGLRNRLILLALCAFVALTVALVADSREHRALRLELAKQDLLRRAESIAMRQQFIGAKAEAVLNGLMLLPAVQADGDAKPCSEALATRKALEPEFGNMVRLRLDGDIDCAAVSNPVPVNGADRAYFQMALLSHSMVVGDLITGRVLGRPTLPFAKAMRNAAGQVTAVLAVFLDLDWLNREMAKAQLPEGARLVVVDAAGTVVVRQPDPEHWVGRNAKNTGIVQHVLGLQHSGVVAETGLDGINRIIGFTNLMDTVSSRLLVWVTVPVDMIEIPVRRQLRQSLALNFSALLLVLGLLAWASNAMLVRPVMVLSGMARRVTRGDLAARTGLPHGDDDIGRLAQILDEMVQTLDERDRRIHRANQGLRVLSAGNRTLVQVTGEPDLLEAMCRSVGIAGGYALVCVVYADMFPTNPLRLMAHWGPQAERIQGLAHCADCGEANENPVGKSVRQGEVMVANDLQSLHARAACVWCATLLGEGVASFVALPLRLGGQVIGALCFGSRASQSFDADAVELLSETADDLSFSIATQRDRAAHERTELALEKAERQFRAAAEASLDALFFLASVRDSQGRIQDFEFVYVNAPAERMLGLERSRIVGQKLCKLIPINRTAGFFEKYVSVVLTGTPLEEEFPISIPEIQAQWLRHQVVRVGDGVAISSRDVTAWKAASAALKESETRLHLIFDKAQDGIAMADIQTGQVSGANAAFCRMVGRAVDEVVGMPVPAFSPAADVPRYMTLYGQASQGEISEALDVPLLARDGRVTYTDITSSLVTITGRQHVLGIFRDITARKAQEADLRRLNRALKTLSVANEALVRATDEPTLLQSMCRIIVESGSYRSAGVIYVQPDPDKTMTRVAQAGDEAFVLDSASLSWGRNGADPMPLGRSIRSGQVEVCHDMAGAPEFAPWHATVLARGYTSNIALPLRHGATVLGVLDIYATDPGSFEDTESRLLSDLATDLAFGIMALRTRDERDRIAHAHAHHAEILQKSLEQSIQAIAATVEARDPYTAGHERRVAELAVAIARELGLSEPTVQGIHLAGLIHDLGKINVPSEILSKPGRLTDLEFALIKTHSESGYQILKDVDFPWPIANIVRQHHEKLDGSGYPLGLSNGSILLEARIITVADVVEAMGSHRPYRPAIGVDAALAEIERGSGITYDAHVADACLKLFREGRFSFGKQRQPV